MQTGQAIGQTDRRKINHHHFQPPLGRKGYHQNCSADVVAAFRLLVWYQSRALTPDLLSATLPVAMALLQIFAKPPEEGKVKTRLIPDLGKAKATKVYRHCLRYTLNLAQQSTFDYQLWLGENSNNLFFAAEQYKLQQGDDLGQRMHHALSQGLAESDAVLLIGSDCLDLTANHLTLAAEALIDNDLVLLPTFDGGFAMIGCRKINASLFSGVQWSSEHVLAQTLNNASKINYRVHLLETVRDIDTLSDLNHYPELRALVTQN